MVFRGNSEGKQSSPTAAFWVLVIRKPWICRTWPKSFCKMLVTLIFHDHSHYREIFLARVLISFVFNNRISSFHIVWFSLINICVVTKQMRGENTSLMASHESNASLFPIKIRRFLMSVNDIRHICENQCVYTPERWKYIKSKEQFWSRSAFLSTKWTHIG